jgi:hypothetical protein
LTRLEGRGDNRHLDDPHADDPRPADPEPDDPEQAPRASRRSGLTNQVSSPASVSTSLSWRPLASPAGLLGLAATAVFVLAAAVSVLFAVRQPIGFGMFLGLLIGLLCGVVGFTVLVLAYGYFALRYRFESGALVVQWLGREDVVPFEKVDGIFAGGRLGQAVRVRGLNWPGYHVGVGRSRSMGLVRYYTTTSDLDDIALIVTPAATYALSPSNPTGFRRELIRRVEASDEMEVRPRPGRTRLTALADFALPVLLVGSLLLLALSVGYIGLRWDGLPETIPLRFAADGTPSGLGPREEIFRVPGIGAAILIANLGLGLAVHARERAAARMLWAAALVVQLLVLVATVRILY